MEREAIIKEVIQYFTDSDHWRRLCSALQDPDPWGTHMHSYVETSIHPNSLEAIITAYFERMGCPSARKIDHMAPIEGMGSLHGIEPQGKPHFDYQWFFKKDVGLKACDGGESGCNLLVWNRWYINQFCNQFPFEEMDSEKEKKLEEYFKSEHFLNGIKIPLRPITTHMHINVHTSVHPDNIQKYAEAAFERLNLKIFYTCPNVYLVDGKYRGKLVFMGKDPEEVFDIGWQFVPETVIEPALEPWVTKIEAGYDIWTKDALDRVMDADYVHLTDDEIKRILDACPFTA